MTPVEVTELVDHIARVWPTPPWEPATAAVYMQHLLELDHAETVKTLNDLIRTETWRPTIAHFHLAAKTRREDRNRALLRGGNSAPLPALERRLSPEERHVPEWRLRRVADMTETPEDIEAAKARVAALHAAQQAKEREGTG